MRLLVSLNNTNIRKMEKRNMNNTFINKFFKRNINVNQKLVSYAAGAVAFANMYPGVVYAAGDTSSITAPLTSLKTLVVAIIGAVGVIILAKNVMEFAQAYQQQDSSTMNSALKGIVAGIMMAGISTVLSFLGY